MNVKKDLVKLEMELRLKVIKSKFLNIIKAKDGDKREIFGKPFEWKGGKWVPAEGGSEKPKPEPKKSSNEELQDKFIDKFEKHVSPDSLWEMLKDQDLVDEKDSVDNYSTRELIKLGLDKGVLAPQFNDFKEKTQPTPPKYKDNEDDIDPEEDEED